MRGRSHRWYSVILAGLIVGLLAAQPVLAVWIKLSGTMPDFGDAKDFLISPDGQYVVYRADQDTDDALELYSAPLSGGTPVRLSGALPTGSAVEADYQISPDGSRVVYRAPQETAEVWELYSVPIAGPAEDGVKLNGTLAANGDVQPYFQISLDSSRVVYLADQEANGVTELYSVPLAGPAEDGLKLNGELVLGGDVLWDCQISPDSSRVVYLADQGVDGDVELYSVPLAGPAEDGLKLNGTLADDGDVESFGISPDSSRVVYLADQGADEIYDLYSVPLAGPAEDGLRLNKTLVADGDVESFGISPDSSRVVYRADQEADDDVELYSVPLAGPAEDGLKLNGDLVGGGDVEEGFEVSSDSSRVVYRADLEADNVIELYSVPLAGPVEDGLKLNGALVEHGDVESFQVSSDSSCVVYRADLEGDEVYELYSVPLAGPAGDGLKLNGTLATDGDVEDFQVSPASSRVAYRADQEADGVYELYSVPLAGPAGEGVKLNGALATDGDVQGFQVSPDGGRVVYRADQDTNDVWELYVADDGQTQVGWSAATTTVAEDAGSAALTVELSGAAVLSVTVDYAVTGGTASGGGVDYTLPAGSLTFDPGQVSRAITVTLVDDGLEEGDETVVVTLSNTQNADLGAVISTTLTIQDPIYAVYLPLVMRDDG